MEPSKVFWEKGVNLEASPYLVVLCLVLARPEFIQTSVESIDSKVVSKCLTLPEKSGGPKVSSISMELMETNNFPT